MNQEAFLHNVGILNTKRILTRHTEIYVQIEAVTSKQFCDKIYDTICAEHNIYTYEQEERIANAVLQLLLRGAAPEDVYKLTERHEVIQALQISNCFKLQ